MRAVNKFFEWLVLKAFNSYHKFFLYIDIIKVLFKRFSSFRENFKILHYYYTSAKTEFIVLLVLFVIVFLFLLYIWFFSFFWWAIFTFLFSIFFFIRIFEFKSLVDKSFYANEKNQEKKMKNQMILYKNVILWVKWITKYMVFCFILLL